MNRYDVASVAKFSPLSFNELAAAPTMMRQKHDASIAQVEALRIQADPLKEHSARALEIKNQMDAEIAKNVDILNKEGYNPTTFQNIIKLNRQYNDIISPTGEIGIINAAKIAEAKAKEDFMKNADKSFGQNVLEQRWLEHRQKYADINGRDKDGKIINIDNLGSPKYVDLDTGIKDVLSTLGSTTRERLLNSGLHFQNTDYGPVMVNSQGSVVTETNDKQLNDALNALKTRFINKTGEGRISRDFEGRTVDEDLAYINSRISAANIYKQNKDYKTNYDVISTGGGPGDGGGTPGSLLTDVVTEAGDKDKSYGQAMQRVSELKAKKAKTGGLTSSEQMDLEKYSAQVNAGNTALVNARKNDKEFASFEKEYQESFNEFNKKIPNSLKTPWINEAKDAKTKMDRILSSAKRLNFSSQDIAKIEKEYHKVINAGKKYFDKRQQIFSKNNAYFTSYNNTPISKGSRDVYEGLNTQLHDILKSAGKSNSNNIIYSVQDENGNFKPLGGNDSSRENEDYDGIIKLLTHAKSVRPIDFADIDGTGLPTMTIEADMGDSEKTYDLAGIGSGSKNIGGKGGKVVFKMNMNNLRTSHDGSATVDPGNWSQQFIKYLINEGGKNTQLGLSMLANITKHQRDKNK